MRGHARDAIGAAVERVHDRVLREPVLRRQELHRAAAEGRGALLEVRVRVERAAVLRRDEKQAPADALGDRLRDRECPLREVGAVERHDERLGGHVDSLPGEVPASTGPRGDGPK